MSEIDKKKTNPKDHVDDSESVRVPVDLTAIKFKSPPFYIYHEDQRHSEFILDKNKTLEESLSKFCTKRGIPFNQVRAKDADGNSVKLDTLLINIPNHEIYISINDKAKRLTIFKPSPKSTTTDTWTNLCLQLLQKDFDIGRHIISLLKVSEFDTFASVFLKIYFSLQVDTQLLFEIFSLLIRKEIKETRQESTILRENTLLTIMLSLYSRNTCAEYLDTLLLPMIEYAEEQEQSGIDYTVNPKENIPEEQLNENIKQTIDLLKKFLDAILNSKDKVPYELCKLLSQIRMEVEKVFPDSKIKAVAGLYFLRIICPAIVSCDKLLNKQLNKERKKYVLISKCLQIIANEADFSESYMSPFNQIKNESIEKIRDFLIYLSAPANSQLKFSYFDLKNLFVLTFDDKKSFHNILTRIHNKLENKLKEVNYPNLSQWTEAWEQFDENMIKITKAKKKDEKTKLDQSKEKKEKKKDDRKDEKESILDEPLSARTRKTVQKDQKTIKNPDKDNTENKEESKKEDQVVTIKLEPKKQNDEPSKEKKVKKKDEKIENIDSKVKKIEKRKSNDERKHHHVNRDSDPEDIKESEKPRRASDSSAAKVKKVSKDEFTSRSVDKVHEKILSKSPKKNTEEPLSSARRSKNSKEQKSGSSGERENSEEKHVKEQDTIYENGPEEEQLKDNEREKEDATDKVSGEKPDKIEGSDDKKSEESNENES